MRPPSRADLQGSILGGAFRLGVPLGRGGFATVFSATGITSGERVAIKVFHPGLLSGVRKQRAFAEAELLLKLEHPNIGGALELHLEEEPAYIVLELIEGVPLSRRIRERCAIGRHFELREIATIMESLCSAVDFAARQGVVHRDLKPHNIMIEPSEGVKVIDFGIARLIDVDADRATTHGRVLGSISYMAPEQARGERVGPAADIFSLGSILFELLTQRRAWVFDSDGERSLAFQAPLVRSTPHNSPLAVLEQTSSAPRPKPSQYRPSLGPEVDAIVARATAANPDERHASAQRLAEAILDALPEEDDLERLHAEDQALTRLASRVALETGVDATPMAPAAPPVTETFDGSVSDTDARTDVRADDLTVPRAASNLRMARRSSLMAWIGGGTLVTMGALLSILWFQTPEPERIEPLPESAPVAARSGRPTANPAPKAETPPPNAAEPVVPGDDRPAGEEDSRAKKRPAAPVRRRSVAAPAKARVRASEPRSRVPALLKRAKANPTDMQAMEALRAAILEEVDGVENTSQAKRIRRLTEGSFTMGDVAGLERAAAALRAAKSK